MNTNITERLRQILAEKFDGKPNAFADAVGVGRSTIVAVTRDKQISKPGFDLLYKIITTLGVDAKWLITGEHSNSDKVLPQQPIIKHDNNLLPIVRTNTLPIKNEIGSISVSDFIDCGAEFATKVVANDMAPLYPSGCMVALREEKEIRYAGKIYLLIQKGEMPIMRKVYPHEDNSLVLSASNPEMYPDIIINKSSIKASYLVVGCIRTDF